MKAGAALGACLDVTTALLKGCFTNPEDIEDIYGVTEESIAIRYGLETERLRLAQLANNERARIRLSLGSSCVACGGRLGGGTPLRTTAVLLHRLRSAATRSTAL
ncbi:hypothetical protein ABZ438_35615 [Streptomyces sp. NPDC005786]|uniref:hypothetical protein n=1 Tax=Streptomyces sp. NPDC005786 TaxID=3154891 RepID=UPI0033FBF493